MEANSKSPRIVGSLLARRDDARPTPLPAPPPETESLAKAIRQQGESIAKLADAIREKGQPSVTVEVPPAVPRSYLIKINRKDGSDRVESYLVEPLPRGE